MIKIDKGATQIIGDVNLLINEIAIGIMVICEMVSERVDVTEEEALESVLQSLQGQKLGRSGMSMEEMEEVMGVTIDKERSKILNEGVSDDKV